MKPDIFLDQFFNEEGISEDEIKIDQESKKQKYVENWKSYALEIGCKNCMSKKIFFGLIFESKNYG